MTLRLLTFVPIAAETGHQSHHHQCHQYCESFKCYQHFKVFQVKLSRKAAVHHQQHHHWRRPLFFKLRKYKNGQSLTSLSSSFQRQMTLSRGSFHLGQLLPRMVILRTFKRPQHHHHPHQPSSSTFKRPQHHHYL